MIKFSENRVKVPFKLRKQVKKIQEDISKSGCTSFEVRKSKDGSIGILGYKTPEHDTVEISTIINPDGKTIYKTYSEYIPENPNGLKSKIIETWDIDKNNYIFNRRTVLQFKDSKIPEVISTMYSDVNRDDGVKIETIYPHREYLAKFSNDNK